MKGVLDWVKRNLIIVITVVLILIFLPVGWVFSSKWNTSVQAAASQAYTTTRSDLQRAGSVSYALPAVLEGEQSISESRAPNRAVTRFFAEQRDVRLEQVAEVVERGTAFNQRDHSELVPGLLPRAASNNSLRLLGLEMAERIAGTRDSEGNVLRPSVYDTLLRRLNAGGPPDEAELGSVLSEFVTRQTEQFTSGSTDGRLTAAQNEQIGADLVRRRLQEYAGRARSLNFYATTQAVGLPAAGRAPVGQPSGFQQGSFQPGAGTGSGWSVIPATPPSPGTITEADAFVWLWDYWVISDVLEAVALANTDPVSGAMTVPEAPVKRVESLRVSAVPVAAGAAAASTDDSGFGGMGSDDRDYGGGGSQATFGGPSGAGSAAPGAPTHTARASDASYDVRTVEMTVIANSQELPRLFEALGRINYMTVVGVDLESIDTWAHLDQGYFYGEDHVVRATIRVETVWLRSWTLPLMPDRVRQGVGAPLASASQSTEPADDFGP